MTGRWLRWLAPLLMLAAALLVWRALRQVDPAQVQQSLAALRLDRLLGAGLCTAGSYLALTGFEWLGVRHAGARLSYAQVALTAFVAMSIGHTIGVAPLSSVALRYRFYGKWGLDVGQIGLVVLLSGVTVTLGLTTLAGLSLLANPDLAEQMLGVSAAAARLLGGLLMLVPIAYVTSTATLRRTIRFRGRTLALPGWRAAVAQLGLGVANYALVSGALQQVLGSASPIGLPEVAEVFVLSHVAGMISHVPGGLGVLEVVAMKLLPGRDALGPLVAFRVLYYLVPLAFGVALFAVLELTGWAGRHRPVSASAK